MIPCTTLSECLEYINTHNPHPREIVLGLERVAAVLAQLGWQQPPCPVVVIAGTNGKGSCLASLKAIYTAAGYRVGTFTSPILFKHNEMLNIMGVMPGDDEFIAAYAQISAAKHAVPLTPFEYHTLAALAILRNYVLDIWLLEVGLGGRLDAVNCCDADVAVITSIALDHTEYLGNTRTAIGWEKAGIFRAQRPAVCGDLDPPATILKYAQQLTTPLYRLGKEFNYQITDNAWEWYGPQLSYRNLPMPQLLLSNVASAVMVVELLLSRLPLHETAVAVGVSRAIVPGRMQVISEQSSPRQVFDVAHNPAALAALAQYLAGQRGAGARIHAVFSILRDKDIIASIDSLRGIDAWYVAPLAVPRGADEEMLHHAFDGLGVHHVDYYASIEEAYRAACAAAQLQDIVVVCGSFVTVAAVANTDPNLKRRLVAAML